MNRRFVAGALTALLLGACSSSSGSAKQPDDEFLDKVEASCLAASKDIRKLDAKDASAPSDLLDIISGMADDLNGMQAPKAIAKAYEDFTSNLDEQVTQLEVITTSLAAGDTTGEQTALDQLELLRTDNDGFVNALSISGCRGLTPRAALTTGDVSITTDTTDTTFTTDTITPDTLISIETAPIETTPIETSAPDTTTATADTVPPADLSVTYNVPTGYTWISFDPPEASGLYNNATIGALVTYYGGGEMRNDADSSTATVYVVQLSEPFTPEYTTSYQYWEVVDQGVDVTTPGGLPVRYKTAAFTDTDCAVYVSGSTGVAICVFAGNDVLGLMDTWVATNPI